MQTYTDVAFTVVAWMFFASSADMSCAQILSGEAARPLEFHAANPSRAAGWCGASTFDLVARAVVPFVAQSCCQALFAISQPGLLWKPCQPC